MGPIPGHIKRNAYVRQKHPLGGRFFAAAVRQVGARPQPRENRPALPQIRPLAPPDWLARGGGGSHTGETAATVPRGGKGGGRDSGRCGLTVAVRQASSHADPSL